MEDPSPKPVRFPKNKIRILLLENIHEVAVRAFEAQGFQVEVKVALSPDELLARIEGTNGHEPIHAIGVRSKTAMTPELLKKAKRLLCVGCFCIGTDNHALEVAAEQAIPVFNAPFSNTRSVAELIIGQIIALSRQLVDRSTECHNGGWYKVSKGCCEVRAKTLGIIGYGHVGSQVSVLAESLGMRVVYFDVIPKLALGNAVQLSSMAELLSTSNYVTLHVPQLESTRNLITETQINMMKRGSYLLNAARGDVVDIDAFAAAVRRGHLAGGTADVFPQEPKKNGDNLFESPMRGLKNVILTPHIGGSTEEAQEAIGVEVSNAIIKFINSGITYGTVNFPEIDIAQRPGTHRLLNVHKNVPGVLSKINTALCDADVNIVQQQLGTNESIGYLVVDMASESSELALSKIKELDTSIRTRVLW